MSLVQQADILSVIPQRPPFVFVDELLFAHKYGFGTSFSVREDNLFLEGEEMQEPALIEHIAQSAAAGFGYLAKENGEGASTGFIGSIDKVTVHALPKLGQRVQTTIFLREQIEQVILIRGHSVCNGTLLMDCDMKIVVGIEMP